MNTGTDRGTIYENQATINHSELVKNLEPINFQGNMTLTSISNKQSFEYKQKQYKTGEQIVIDADIQVKAIPADTVKKADSALVLDFDRTIVKGHMHNYISRALKQDDQTLTAAHINQFLSEGNNGFRNPETLIELIREALGNNLVVAVASHTSYPYGIKLAMQVLLGTELAEQITIVTCDQRIAQVCNIKSPLLQAIQNMHEITEKEACLLVDDNTHNIHNIKNAGYQGVYAAPKTDEYLTEINTFIENHKIKPLVNNRTILKTSTSTLRRQNNVRDGDGNRHNHIVDATLYASGSSTDHSKKRLDATGQKNAKEIDAKAFIMLDKNAKVGQYFIEAMNNCIKTEIMQQLEAKYIDYIRDDGTIITIKSDAKAADLEAIQRNVQKFTNGMIIIKADKDNPIHQCGNLEDVETALSKVSTGVQKSLGEDQATFDEHINRIKTEDEYHDIYGIEGIKLTDTDSSPKSPHNIPNNQSGSKGSSIC